MSLTETGVINAGEFSYGLIKTAEFNFHGIADNYIFCILPLIGYSVSYLCSSYHLICSFAVCGKLENVIAFNKTGSCESAVAVLFDVLPACAFISGELNSGFCTVKGSIEIKGCGIFKRIHCVKLCIPFISRADRFHGKLALCAAHIDNHKACTLRIGGTVKSGITGAAADFYGVIAHFDNCNAFGNALNVHPVGLFALAGITGAAIDSRRHFNMAAAGEHSIIEVRLDHDVCGIAVDNLPCAAICTQTEGFAYAKGEIILSVDVHQSAGFHTLCKHSAVNIVYGAFGVFTFPKGHSNIFILIKVKITRFGYFTVHRNTVGVIAFCFTELISNGSVSVIFGGSSKLFNIKVFNLAENSYICALRCGYGVIGTSNKGKALILSCGCSLVKYLVYGICNAIILGKLFAEIYSPVIKQSVTMGMKQSRSYDLLFIIDILCAGNNFLHFTGVNINGVISDCFYLFIGGVVVNSYKSHLLLAVNRLAVGADFYADRRFKGHSAELLIILSINGAIGIHTLGNDHFVNMVFADHSFIGDFFRRKSGFAVLVAIEGYVNGGGSNIHGDGVFIFAHSRENIAAVSAFAVLALGAGFISGADNIVALCAFYGFGVVAVVFGNIGGMFLISGADFLAGADNLAALFAGNGHGVVAVAL